VSAPASCRTNWGGDSRAVYIRNTEAHEIRQRIQSPREKLKTGKPPGSRFALFFEFFLGLGFRIWDFGLGFNMMTTGPTGGPLTIPNVIERPSSAPATWPSNRPTASIGGPGRAGPSRRRTCRPTDGICSPASWESGTGQTTDAGRGEAPFCSASSRSRWPPSWGAWGGRSTLRPGHLHSTTDQHGVNRAGLGRGSRWGDGGSSEPCPTPLCS